MQNIKQTIVRIVAIASSGAVPLVCAGDVAHAQDAAETAVILGGTSVGQKRAQEKLGSGIAGAIGRAANAIPNARSQRSAARMSRAQRRRPARANFAIALPADVDPLDSANVETYALANGASIRVSGGLRRPATTAADQVPPRSNGGTDPN